jgi:hypothetical protein
MGQVIRWLCRKKMPPPRRPYARNIYSIKQELKMLVDTMAARTRAASASKLPPKSRFKAADDSSAIRQGFGARPLVERVQTTLVDDQPSDHGYDAYLEAFY